MGSRFYGGSRQVEGLLDKIEDRLRDAAVGLHQAYPPASADELESCSLPPDQRALWERWNGLELGNGDAVLLPLSAVVSTTSDALAAGRIQAGDTLIGRHGNDELVIAADPYEEGADVLLVTEDGERLPYASSVPCLVLGLLADISVMYDEHGEYQRGLFGSDGELLPVVRRRLLRRRLDVDPDAPLARLELGRSLREAGELVAARAELRRALKVAPQFGGVHFELGRTAWAADDPASAVRAFLKAAEAERNPTAAAYFLAWAALVDPSTRAASAAEVRKRQPDFVVSVIASVREALEQNDVEQASESLALGLAVSPHDAQLLALRQQLDPVSR